MVLKLLIFLTGRIPWILIGDFNDVLSFNEKLGGNSVNQTRVREFKRMLDDCHLLNLAFEGPGFTWCNKCDNGPFILELLDGAICN